MAATWLADVLRAAGCAVDETRVPDWKSRGHTDGPFNPVGVLGHHTAGPKTGDLPSFGTVLNGRADLAGPLANLMLSRSGVFVPIAAGRCWHAGAADNRALWPWVPNGDGNGYLIGIEAESAGTGDWTPQQLAAYPRGVAALLRKLNAPADRFLGHLEWAPSRKPDPAGWPGGMNGFRQTVANNAANITPTGGGFLMALSDADQQHLLEMVGGLVYALMPENGINSQGEIVKRLRGIDGSVAALVAKAPGDIDAAAIAAAIPADLARQVADELGKRLNTP